MYLISQACKTTKLVMSTVCLSYINVAGALRWQVGETLTGMNE